LGWLGFDSSSAGTKRSKDEFGEMPKVLSSMRALLQGPRNGLARFMKRRHINSTRFIGSQPPSPKLVERMT
jgi:hypothetical protein